MAGITVPIYLERVKREATLMGLNLTEEDIWSSQDSALQRLADDVWRDPQRRAYAQVEVAAATLSSGVVSFSSYTDMLQESVRNVVHSDGTQVCLSQFGVSRRWLSYERSLINYYGVIEAASLYVAMGDGAGTAAPNGTCSLVYNSAPTLANVHAQLIDDLIKRHIMFAQATAAERMAA